MSPNLDALRRHRGYFWIIVGARCLIAFIGAGAVLIFLKSQMDVPVVLFEVMFACFFGSCVLILVGARMSREHIQREASTEIGPYLDGVKVAQFHDMFIVVWKDILVPGHRKKERLDDGRST